MKYSRILLVGLAFVLAVIAVGCVTITTGTTESISITSNVDGADLFLDGVLIGKTSFTGVVPKNKKELRVEKEGYETATIVLSKTLAGMFWGNIITGGTLGSTTDFSSGAAYNYAPATYQVELKLSGQASLEYRQQLAVRKFSMLFIDQISQDVANGDGEHPAALVERVNGEDGNSVDKNIIRDALISSEGNAVRFGNTVVELI